LQISPSLHHISLNNENYFIIQSGSGKWQLEKNNILTINKSGIKLMVTTGDSAGLYSVYVYYEVTKERIEAQVQVYKPLEVQE